RVRDCELAPLFVRLGQQRCPRVLIEIVLTCLHRDPDQRFTSALALAEALEDALEGALGGSSAARRELALIAGACAKRRELESCCPSPRDASWSSPWVEQGLATSRRSQWIWLGALASAGWLGLQVPFSGA